MLTLRIVVSDSLIGSVQFLGILSFQFSLIEKFFLPPVQTFTKEKC